MNQILRIMIVEDDPLTQFTIEENLVKAGFIVCGKAHDYASAIQIMKKELPDMALIDIDFGGSQPDGIETAKELMRIKSIPFIYLTAFTEAETFKKAKKTNPLAYLHKPFRPSELTMQIELAIHNFYQGNMVDIVSMPDHIYIPDGQNKLVRINYKNMYYVNAHKVYTEFFLTQEEFQRIYPDKNYHAQIPNVFSVGFGHLLSFLPDNFFKLSRSITINLDHLNKIESNQIFVGPHELPLIEGGRKLLLERLNVIRSRKKK
ncbi:response regulator [Emticicia sp. BO119]|uniref:response regulator n=1 Tax=Emticicia sp. BO119 TaxID=2757768 RepID=UPI0015EFFD60|nr:response regulator [Emticicia sp. BO119]MBA4850617.1 response regulator [Emticicia sp. BO119]